MLILNQITGEARKHIQDKSELQLEDALKLSKEFLRCLRDVCVCERGKQSRMGHGRVRSVSYTLRIYVKQRNLVRIK